MSLTISAYLKCPNRASQRLAGMTLLLALGLGAGCGSSGSSGNGGTDPGQMQMPGTEPKIGMTYTGDGTYYGATGGGACSYDPTPNNLMVAAMNSPQWANSSVCGMCVEVTGPKGEANKIVIRIVDLCPECKTGDLDLSQEAFAKIADPVAGRVKISWQQVECAVSGPLSYRFKEGSTQYWMGVQVRNSRLPINKLEVQKGGNFTAMNPESYGYYTLSSPGTGPFTFRMTATTGEQVTETGVALKDSQVVQGSQQFP